MKLKIKVTKEILEASKHCPFLRGSTDDQVDILKETCAFAVALREIFPDAKVQQQTVQLFPKERAIILPIAMTKYIQRFDNCTTVEEREKLPEASFELDIPDEMIDRIGIEEVHRILKESKTLELCP